MTIMLGTGDEKCLSELSDRELMEERDRWNATLPASFFLSSASYDVASRVVRELDEEMLRREQEGPPWNVD